MQGDDSKEGKDSKRLSRAELLEMLIEQSKEVESLKKKVDELQKQLDDAKAELDAAIADFQEAIVSDADYAEAKLVDYEKAALEFFNSIRKKIRI